MKTVCLAVTFLTSLSMSAHAQSFPIERLDDWQFRFYTCKNVLMNAALVTRLMAAHQITDQSGLDQLQDTINPAIAKNVTETEKSFQFSEGEAAFVSDLTFALLSGMLAGGYELSDLQLMQSGNDICVNAINDMAQLFHPE